MKNDLVSIIIPCYNSSEFIYDTLQSILKQTYSNIEVIIVNDGSTDDTGEKALSINDKRINYFYQANAGVSAARNFGLKESKGEYIIFFDSDDLMTDEYISSRVLNIEKLGLDFICGPVKKFTLSTIDPGSYRGTSSNVTEEILFYNQSVATCPSNYLFKSLFLKKNKLQFNTELSSTADKYFLLQCAISGKSGYSDKCTELLYRVGQGSMSHLLTKKLVRDNEKYYQFVEKNGLIPHKIENKSLFLGYYILLGANVKIKDWKNAIKYGLKALLVDPFQFVQKTLFPK
ncbi:MAG: glycosyltransferase family 2 protein [Bacteroidia bacterium]